MNPNNIVRFEVAIFLLVLSAYCAQAQTLKVLHAFTGKADGGVPNGPVTFDFDGNLYGLTNAGGTSEDCNPPGCGVVYKLAPNASGGWHETPLLSFGYEAGEIPQGNLLISPAGALIGATVTGANTDGEVFELSPASSGWQESFLYSLNGVSDGDQPLDGLVADKAGNLYGTAAYGGKVDACFREGCGTVFELSPTSSGIWQETTLYTFTGGADGANPMARLTMDSAGNLYGTTPGGGKVSKEGACAIAGCGVVFELSRNSLGSWTETVLYAFSGPDGLGPWGSLVMDAAGNLYGTTLVGGTGCTCGVVFELFPSSSGWHEIVLHHFTGGAGGGNPTSGLALDSVGNLYGTTSVGAGGCVEECGVIFKLAPPSGVDWTFTRLHEFTGGLGGSESTVTRANNPLVFGPDGNLYGTTPSGGAFDAGVVFQIAP